MEKFAKYFDDILYGIALTLATGLFIGGIWGFMAVATAPKTGHHHRSPSAAATRLASGYSR